MVWALVSTFWDCWLQSGFEQRVSYLSSCLSLLLCLVLQRCPRGVWHNVSQVFETSRDAIQQWYQRHQQVEKKIWTFEDSFNPPMEGMQSKGHDAQGVQLLRCCCCCCCCCCCMLDVVSLAAVTRAMFQNYTPGSRLTCLLLQVHVCVAHILRTTTWNMLGFPAISQGLKSPKFLFPVRIG